jgi:hypothetical protein
MRIVAAIVAGVALAGCSPPAPLGPQPTQALGVQLMAPQIRNEIVGNTGTGTRTSTNTTYSMYVAPDGTAIAKLPTRTETGRWRITDDGLFCMQWPIDFNGQEVCQTVHKAGITVQLASRESLEELVFQAGNKL